MSFRSFTVRFGLLAFLVTAGLARPASAQTGTGGATGVTALTSDDLLIVVQSAPGVALPDFDLQRFFNVGNCQCNVPVYLYVTFSTSGFAKKLTLGTGTVEFWIGSACNSLLTRNCQKMGDTVDLTTFANNSGVVINTDAQTLSQSFGQPAISSDGGISSGAGASGPAACTAGTAFSQTVWALVTFTGDTPYDVTSTLSVNVDLAPPPQPSNVAVSPGNEALIVSWTGIDTTLSTGADLQGYQILCDRGGALQVFANGSFSSGYQGCATNALPTGLDSNVNGLDTRFVCSPLLSALATSYRVKILENQVTYGVSVVAIDTHQNASAPDVFYQSPIKTLSFYDTYRNGDSANTKPGQSPDPGRATGGFCAVGGNVHARQAGAAGVLTLMAALVVMAARRRNRRS